MKKNVGKGIIIQNSGRQVIVKVPESIHILWLTHLIRYLFGNDKHCKRQMGFEHTCTWLWPKHMSYLIKLVTNYGNTKIISALRSKMCSLWFTY